MIIILGYPEGYSQPNTPIEWLRKKMVCVLVSDDVSFPIPHISGPNMADTVGESTRINAAVGWCWRAQAGGGTRCGGGD